jgi:hypothetical protein
VANELHPEELVVTTKTVSTGITRFDLEDRKVHGFMVRISRKGKRFNQFFSDKQCGGKRKARKAADNRYAELLEEYGPIVSSTKGRLTSRNSTGVVGVHIAHSADSRWPDCEYWAYCASWVDDDGSRRKISFGWNKYGEDESLELATIARTKEITDREAVLKIRARRVAAAERRKKNQPPTSPKPSKNPPKKKKPRAKAK